MIDISNIVDMFCMLAHVCGPYQWHLMWPQQVVTLTRMIRDRQISEAQAIKAMSLDASSEELRVRVYWHTCQNGHFGTIRIM